MKRLTAVLAVALVLPLVAVASARAAVPVRVTLSNGIVSRTWTLAPFKTDRLVDLRTGRVWSQGSNDVTLTIGGVDVRGDQLTATSARRESIAGGGTRITFDLGVIDRVVEVYPGVAGFRSRTVVKVPGVLTKYTLDEVAPGGDVAVTTHAFRAGADWREQGWAPFTIGDAHTGDWRVSTTGGQGQPVTGTAQWLSAAAPNRASVFMVMERNDYASSTMTYDGRVAAAKVDLSRDVVYTGPFEEQIHVESPAQGVGRSRVVTPGLALEPVFTGLALDGDDEPWQHHKYLRAKGNLDYRHTVTFNSDSVDANRISTGAKDDMDIAEVQRQATIARELGVETFILDDGWQAASGDWCPDSPECPEPRDPMFPHRFPDATFAAVKDALGPDIELGLWMSPMSFNPASNTFRSHPEWSCTPLGTGTAVANALTPNDGSNEPGIGLWGAAALPHIENRILTAIEQWGVRYFKFDFLVWLDCAGATPTDMYQYREAFVAMLDRLIASHPEVVFQIDETNDYRLFPFESVARGPSWFQNGSPSSPQLLHNLWSLEPWVPGSSLGQHTFGGSERNSRSVDYLMAVALGSHVTFKTDLTTLTPAQVTAARPWVDLYKTHRDALSGFTYPLLDDPVSGATWTALQPWDVDTQRGMVLVYRQDTSDADHRVPLRGLRAGSFRVRDARTGAVHGVYSREELAGAGLPITLAEPFSAAVLTVEPVE